ncbi:hypothetical protein F5Y14DRAFT_428988 [Nemania sp. NC0429]|nr:hypothetical protein F5Y14DRAFT_428988 [Nemania sp. NC0429]
MLPEVLIVRELWTKCMTRNLCDRVPVEIAARLPNLLSGRWVMNDWGIRYLGLRQTHRRELAQAVAEFLPQSSSLRDLSFQMPVSHLYSDYQNFSFGTLHPENLTLDTLSNAIRAATAHMSTLRRLQITGVIDKSLLWPGPTRALSEPYWQNLEYLHVTFSSRRPSGGHYFVDAHNPPQELVPRSHLDVPPGYKQSEEEEVAAVASFSIGAELCPSVDLDGQTWQPVDEVVPDASLKPLIRAFGQACLQMPMLKSADVVTIIPVPRESNGNGGSSRWGVWYFSPGTMHPRLEWLDSAFSEDTHDRRLIWDVKDWRPDADLRRLLGKIGDDKYGGRLVEKFVKSGF